MPLAQIQKVRNYYRATAADYREFWTGEGDLAMHFGYHDGRRQTHPQALIRMNEMMSSLACPKRGDRVLDAGCGCGGSAIWLALNKGCRVEGVNVVPEQIQIARRFAAKCRVSTKVNFSQQDYCATTFRAGSFDLVWALESVIHTENKRAFAEEAARVLRKGGRLIIADLMLREGHPRGLLDRKRFRQVENGWAITSLLTPRKARSLLTNTGFTNVRLWDWTKNIRLSVKRLADLCRRALPEAKAKFSAGYWKRERLENILACIYIDDLLDTGTFKYMVMTARKS